MTLSMKKYIFILACACLIPGCSSTSVREDDAWNKLRTCQRQISENRQVMARINDAPVAKSGFYYVVDRQGIVVYHPSVFLIGRSFRQFDFMQEILEKNEGVVRYNREGMAFRIYFMSLNDNEILCLSLPESEIGRS